MFFNSYFQRLEDSVLRAGEDYTLRGTDGNPAKIPARVREIITKNLSGEGRSYTPTPLATFNMTTLQEENRLLAAELNRVEDLLSASRAERDELGIKYNALSERVCFIFVKCMCLVNCVCVCVFVFIEIYDFYNYFLLLEFNRNSRLLTFKTF